MTGSNSHVSTNNQTTHTVADFLKNPTLIKRTLEVKVRRDFIAESLFQGGFNADGGAVLYHESLNDFVDEDLDANENFAVAEGQEPHQVYTRDVGPQTARVKKYFIEGWVTFEDEERNQLGSLARLTTRMGNTMVKKLDGAVMNMLLGNSNIRNLTAGGAWATTTYANLYDDLIEAQSMINDETLAGGTYVADTLVVSNNTYAKLLRNESIRNLYVAMQRAADAPYYTGQMGTIAGLNIMRTPYMTDDYAFMLQKGAIGGIADEKPLTTKPVERDEHRERIFVRMVRRTVAFLTDPGAIVRIDITP